MTLKHPSALQIGEFVLFLCNFGEPQNLYPSYRFYVMPLRVSKVLLQKSWVLC